MQPRYIARSLSSLTACMLLSGISFAQVHTPVIDENRKLFTAEEQYLQGDIRLSGQSADRYLQSNYKVITDKSWDDVEKAHFYAVISGLGTNAFGCADTAVAFLNNTANDVYRDRTAFALARYYFRHNEFAAAITFYKMAGIANLDNEEIADEKFEMAYCYFNNRQFDIAEPMFASIKELQGDKYFSAGNYYYGLLAYNENNYQEALKSFDRIKESQQYRSVVPYYIAEIYYFTGNRKKALEEALKLIKQPEKLYYDNELHLLAAQCLFEEQRFSEALSYFEYYYDHTDKIRKEDLYEVGYCYYKLGEWNKATDKFKLLSNTEDSLGQTSMYLLGDCYIKTDDKVSARNAFGTCANMSFNKGQQEAAMILYAKLSYEMGYYDVAMQQLTELLHTFPESRYKDEAKTLLSDLLIKSNNYADALAYLKDVQNKNEQYRRTYQKVSFGYAMQLAQNNNIAEADEYLSQCLQNSVDENYEAAANFWKGELAYSLHHYNDVLSYSQAFLVKNRSPRSVQRISNVATDQHANLNIGYAEMALNNYAAAQAHFNKAQEESGDKSTGMVAIAREADAVFMQKDYSKALSLYNKILAANGADADYARFQKGILLGLQGNTNEKISILEALSNSSSPYSSKARYELALTYIEINKYEKAISLLSSIAESSDSKGMAPKAWLKMGFSYQQTGEQQKALDAYKRIIKDYPSSEERAAALDALKSLYIESNQPAAYSKLLREYHLPSADSNSIDSTYYAAAEAQFASGNWAQSRDAMSQYLQQYPHGTFVVKAHYYKAESNFQLKNYNDALPDYDVVLQDGTSEFSENSALRAGWIAAQQKDYKKSITYYKKLLEITNNKDNSTIAYGGLMKSYFNTSKYSETSDYADSLINREGISKNAKAEARLYKAKALQADKKPDEALAIYQQLTAGEDGALAAEARYHIAEIYLQQDKLKDAETAANNTIRQSAGYDEWIVRSYILLADVLTRQKDYFNAKATLQSIIKNTKSPELKEEAKRKLEIVKGLEKQHSKLSEE